MTSPPRLLPAAVLLAGMLLPQSSAGQGPDSSATDDILEQIRMECTAAWYARTLIGKRGCVAGRLYDTDTNRHGDLQLILCPPNRECAFRAVVNKRDRDAVGDLSYLEGKVIAVTGTVVRDHDNPRIYVTDKDQVKIAPGNPIEFDATHHRPRGKVEKRKIPVPQPSKE